jgi:hypothetical protein
MATRSFIARQHADGTLTAIACNWSGFPEHNGHILQTAYATSERVDALLALGGLMTLGFALGPDDVQPDTDPQFEAVCTALHRDLGHDLWQFTGLDETRLLACAVGWRCDYAYLWRDGAWFVAA